MDRRIQPNAELPRARRAQMVAIIGFAVRKIVVSLTISVIEMKISGNTVLQGLQLGDNRPAGGPSWAIEAIRISKPILRAFGC
jgi:hypothetical protein